MYLKKWHQENLMILMICCYTFRSRGYKVQFESAYVLTVLL